MTPSTKRIISTIAIGLPAFVVAVAVRAAEAPRVVASVIPIHSLVAGVMEGVGTPELLVKKYGSPHSYQLRPSDAAKLHRARLVFWVGETMETFLRKPLSIVGRETHIVELIKTDGLLLLRNRDGNMWKCNNIEQYKQYKRSRANAHGKYDTHLWLNPENAKLLVNAIVGQLSNVDPVNAEVYRSNGKKVRNRIARMDRGLQQRLRPVKNMPYVVLHDAYQYLEHHYGLNAVGSLLTNVNQMPSAKRVGELRCRIKRFRARCAFAESLFESALINTVTEGTGARRGVLDALGTGAEPGPDAYFKMMNANVSAIVDCLSR